MSSKVLQQWKKSLSSEKQALYSFIQSRESRNNIFCFLLSTQKNESWFAKDCQICHCKNGTVACGRQRCTSRESLNCPAVSKFCLTTDINLQILLTGLHRFLAVKVEKIKAIYLSWSFTLFSLQASLSSGMPESCTPSNSKLYHVLASCYYCNLDFKT